MKKFEKAEIEVIRFEAMDILAGSNATAPTEPSLKPIDPDEGDIV